MEIESDYSLQQWQVTNYNETEPSNKQFLYPDNHLTLDNETNICSKISTLNQSESVVKSDKVSTDELGKQPLENEKDNIAKSGTEEFVKGENNSIQIVETFNLDYLPTTATLNEVCGSNCDKRDFKRIKPIHQLRQQQDPEQNASRGKETFPCNQCDRIFLFKLRTSVIGRFLFG